MCGRFAFFDIQKFYSRFNIKNRLRDLLPHYNIAPGFNLPAVVRDNKKNRAEVMKWGLIPSWAKEPKIGYKMINACMESIATKPSFRKPLKSQRCLVPANGFYEWGNKEEDKTPYFVHLKDNKLFAMAGLYDIWQDVEGREIRSFTIITTPANSLISKIHDRMPAVLKEKHENSWMDEETPAKEAVTFLKPYENKDMKLYPISRRVNKPINDDPDLIRPEYGKGPPLEVSE